MCFRVAGTTYVFPVSLMSSAPYRGVAAPWRNRALSCVVCGDVSAVSEEGCSTNLLAEPPLGVRFCALNCKVDCGAVAGSLGGNMRTVSGLHALEASLSSPEAADVFGVLLHSCRHSWTKA